MNYDEVRLMSQKDRDNILQTELNEDKIKLIAKYALFCNTDLSWEMPKKEMESKRTICSHLVMKGWDMIGLIFLINRLCYGKMKYFNLYWEEFTACKHDWRLGFIDCELWDMEFIRHKETNNIVDLRWLKGITDIKVFRQWCKYFTVG